MAAFLVASDNVQACLTTMHLPDAELAGVLQHLLAMQLLPLSPCISWTLLPHNNI